MPLAKAGKAQAIRLMLSQETCCIARARFRWESKEAIGFQGSGLFALSTVSAKSTAFFVRNFRLRLDLQEFKTERLSSLFEKNETRKEWTG